MTKKSSKLSVTTVPATLVSYHWTYYRGGYEENNYESEPNLQLRRLKCAFDSLLSFRVVLSVLTVDDVCGRIFNLHLGYVCEVHCVSKQHDSD